LISLNSIVALEEARRTHKKKARKWDENDKCICSSFECEKDLYEGLLPDNKSGCACKKEHVC